MKKYFEVTLEKESLIFSAAHFITFGEQELICEAIHGHNYRVACEVRGTLDQHACVIDFIWLRDRLQQLTARLDHHVLLPQHHAQISVREIDEHVEVQFEQRRWVFPAEEVVLLPIENTTAERLAEWMGEQILDEIQKLGSTQLSQLRLGVDENEGQWAWCCWENID